MVVVIPRLIPDHDTGKVTGGICFTCLKQLVIKIYLISVWRMCKPFRNLLCANCAHCRQVSHKIVHCGFCNLQFHSYSVNRDLPITHHNAFHDFDVFVSNRGYWSSRSRYIFNAAFRFFRCAYPIGNGAI